MPLPVIDRKRSWTIFVSYSHKDWKYCDPLAQTLNNLQRKHPGLEYFTGNSDLTYEALKSYIMLNEHKHFELSEARAWFTLDWEG